MLAFRLLALVSGSTFGVVATWHLAAWGQGLGLGGGRVAMWGDQAGPVLVGLCGVWLAILFVKMRSLERAHDLDRQGLQPMIVRAMGDRWRRVYYGLVLYTVPVGALGLLGFGVPQAVGFSALQMGFSGVTALFAAVAPRVARVLEAGASPQAEGEDLEETQATSSDGQ